MKQTKLPLKRFPGVTSAKRKKVIGPELWRTWLLGHRGKKFKLFTNSNQVIYTPSCNNSNFQLCSIFYPCPNETSCQNSSHSNWKWKQVMCFWLWYFQWLLIKFKLLNLIYKVFHELVYAYLHELMSWHVLINIALKDTLTFSVSLNFIIHICITLFLVHRYLQWVFFLSFFLNGLLSAFCV